MHMYMYTCYTRQHARTLSHGSGRASAGVWNVCTHSLALFPTRPMLTDMCVMYSLADSCHVFGYGRTGGQPPRARETSGASRSQGYRHLQVTHGAVPLYCHPGTHIRASLGSEACYLSWPCAADGRGAGADWRIGLVTGAGVRAATAWAQCGRMTRVPCGALRCTALGSPSGADTRPLGGSGPLGRPWRVAT